MSLLAPAALGVDATDGTLKAVLVTRRGRRVSLRRTWRVAYDHEPDPAQGALGALEAFFRTVRPGPLPRIVLAAPPRGHFSRTYLVPAMEAERLAEMVRYQVLSELEVPAEELLVRWHLRKGVAENQAHAVALSRRRVEHFVSELVGRRIPFDDLQTPGFALASFVEHERPAGRDRILLGVGTLATELVLLREDGIWTRHLPLGLAHSEREADVADALAAEVRAAVGYLLPGDVEFRPLDVVLTEEGALHAEFTGALKRALGVGVTRFSELQRIVPARRARLAGPPEEVLAMGKALGLALLGLGLGRFHCPLVSSHPRRAAARRLPLAAANLALASFGLLGVTALAEQRVLTLEGLLPATRTTEVAELASRADEIRGQIKLLKLVNSRLETLAARRPAAFSVRRALAASQRTDGGRPGSKAENVWLAPTELGRPGLLSLGFQGPAPEGIDLAALLEQRFGAAFPGASVSGSGDKGLSRWTVELPLP